MEQKEKEPTEKKKPEGNEELLNFDNTLMRAKGAVIAFKTNDDGTREDITFFDFLRDIDSIITSAGNGSGEELADLARAWSEYLEGLRPKIEEDMAINNAVYKGLQLENVERTLQTFERINEFLKRFLADVDALTDERREELAPKGKATNIREYVATKDTLSKAVFGELKRNNKVISLAASEEQPYSEDFAPTFTLWKQGKDKNLKEVRIQTFIDFDREVLKAAGIIVGKNASKRARQVFNAMLSHLLAGNNLLTLRMLAKVIFNIGNNAKLTDAQKQYIIDGATEVFGTSLYINTELPTEEEGILSLYEAKGVNIKHLEQLFPGRITSAVINGSYVETAIELFALPTLYKLQNAMEGGQIMRIQAAALAIPGRTDEELIIIRDYLARRIDTMKHDKKQSRFIIFDNILEELGIDPKDRSQRNKRTATRKKAERILDYWKVYQGDDMHIKDYKKLTRTGQPVKGTATIYKFEILLTG